MTQTVSSIDASQSNNNIIRSGITIQEVVNNQKNIDLFNHVDTDKDRVISEQEYKVYNAPYLVENADKKQISVFEHGPIATNPDETQYYPGLKFEQVKPDDRLRFVQLDIDKNDELSLEEIQKAISETQDIYNCQKSQMLNVTKTSKITDLLFVCTAVGGIAIGGVFAILADLLISFKNKRGCLFAAGAMLTAIAGGLGALGSYLYSQHVKKKNKENNAHNQNLVNQMEEKYKNSDYAKYLINTYLKPNLSKQNPGKKDANRSVKQDDVDAAIRWYIFRSINGL